MNLLLLAVLLLPMQEEQGKTRSIGNARTLIDRDWAELGQVKKTTYQNGKNVEYTTNRADILSMREAEKWSKGTAWIISTEEAGKYTSSSSGTNSPSDRYSAWKGVYTVYNHPDDEEAILLSLGFTKRYVGRDEGGRISWDLDTDFEPTGIDVEIPLDGDSVPSGEIVMTPTRAYYVDSKGEETIKRGKPRKLLDKLLGEGPVRQPYSVDFWPVGDTRKMTKLEVVPTMKIVKSPPPGFKVRRK